MTTTNSAKKIKTTIKLCGYEAVRYATITGVALRYVAPDRSGTGGNPPGGQSGLNLPPRAVTPAEASDILRATGEGDRVTCTATHGELPYRGTGPIAIDWPAIHAAAIVVDAERRATRTPGMASHGVLGFDGSIDAFGGGYYPRHWESRGLAGAVSLLEGAHMVRRAAWEAIHRASRARRARDGRAQAAGAIGTAFALDHLYRALAAVGIYDYRPSEQICGVTGYSATDTIQVTGLRWLAGEAVDGDFPTMAEASALLGGRSANT